jgi:hypothetical protein
VTKYILVFLLFQSSHMYMYKRTNQEDIRSRVWFLHCLKEGIVALRFTHALTHYATSTVSLGKKQLKPALQLIVSCLITGTTV